MKIFVYEHLCASTPPALGQNSLEVEGRAMLTRVLLDLSRVRGVDLITCLHPSQSRPVVPRLDMARSLPTLRHAVMRLASESDYSLIIAPESDGVLVEVCQWVLNAGGRLLGPDLEQIKLFSDKIETAKLLAPRSIPTTILPMLPRTVGPLVIKPRRGAGAEHTALGTREQANTMMAAIRCQDYAGELIAQPFWPGLKASVAVVLHPEQAPVLLPAVEQFIEADPVCNGDDQDSCPAKAVRWFGYHGGRLPLPPSLDIRARDLARYVIEKAPRLQGYFGIDVILAPGLGGEFDRIVEVNPRLTSSYTGYSTVLGSEFMGELLLGRTRVTDVAIAAKIQDFVKQGRHLRFATDGSSDWESSLATGDKQSN